MSRHPYPGLSNPVSELRALEPYHQRLREMAQAYHRGAGEYAALNHAAEAFSVVGRC